MDGNDLAERQPCLGFSALSPVCTDNLNTGVAVMKSAQDGV